MSDGARPTSLIERVRALIRVAAGTAHRLTGWATAGR
jgi:hypothetical protein